MADSVKLGIHTAQILCLGFCACIVSTEDITTWTVWLPIISRYVLYILISRALVEARNLFHDAVYSKKKLKPTKIIDDNKKFLALFLVSAAILRNTQQSLDLERFLWFSVAYLFTNFPYMKVSRRVSYGVGMACNFFEGYLTHVIPSDGTRFFGFEENITLYESRHGVVFPVKRLFIIITKSMFSPPDLKQFNKSRRDVPYLERCESLKKIIKDVAGVKSRQYRNSAYKIHRPAHGPGPGPDKVYLSAECATPLLTLHKVLQRRALYPELNNMDVDEVVTEFCSMLQSIITNSPECCGKCELVYFDDTDPSQNLAQVLLDKIKEIEPNFEEIISKAKEE